MSLLRWGDFIGHSGDVLHFKIECEALTTNDWACAAELIRERVPRFGRVVGVPRGGLPLAHWLSPWATGYRNDPLLIVDDVWTTGGSMERCRSEYDGFSGSVIGAVLFARNPVTEWVTPVFQLTAAPSSSAASTRTSTP